MYRAPLTIHVVWHPASERGAEFAQALFAHLFEDPEDPASHGLRIPVFHWRSTGEERDDAPPPADLPLETSERSVVVPIIDDHFLGSLGWDDFLTRTRRALRSGDELVPVQLVARGDLERQGIRLAELPERLQLPALLNALTHILWAMLDPEDSGKVPAFISYATSDGQHIADPLTAFIAGHGSTDAFFAPRDVRGGAGWRAELRREAARSVLLAIRTDAYASRQWCQIEVLEAKRAGMPVVVLDALATREARGFPYLGNGPVLRWRTDDPELLHYQVLGAMLREALRSRHFRLRVERLCSLRAIDVPSMVRSAPPELVTLLDGARDGLLVYPDPPLGTDELGVIRRLDRGIEPVTPLMLLAS